MLLKKERLMKNVSLKKELFLRSVENKKNKIELSIVNRTLISFVLLRLN